MLNTIRVFAVLAFAGLVSSQASAEEQVNNGQDITRPLTRVDLRYQFVNMPFGHQQSIYTLRSDGAIKFSGGWELALRGDLPVYSGDVIAGDNPGGMTQAALGDVLTQAVAVHSFNPREALGVGVQMVWPTATNDQSGSGKYQALPILGFRESLPEISNGSFFVPFARYDTAYAGNSDRRDIKKLEFGPTLNLMLPERMFFILYSSPEIVYDLNQKAWHVPMNFMVGKMFTKTIVGSAEFFIPMFEGRNYATPYNFKMEARVGYFFSL